MGKNLFGMICLSDNIIYTSIKFEHSNIEINILKPSLKHHQLAIHIQQPTKFISSINILVKQSHSLSHEKPILKT